MKKTHSTRGGWSPSTPRRTRRTRAAPSAAPGLSLQHCASPRPPPYDAYSHSTASPRVMRPVADPPDRRLSSRLRRREPSSRPREEDERRDVTLGSLRNLAPADVRGDGGPVPVVPVRVTPRSPFDPSSATAGRLGQRGRGPARGWREPTALASCSFASASIAPPSLRASSPKRDVREREPARTRAGSMFAAAASGRRRPAPIQHRLILCSTSSMTPGPSRLGRMSSASRSSLGIPRPMASLSRASWIRTAERSASIASLRLPPPQGPRAGLGAAATANLRCDIAKSLTNPRLPGSWSPCALLDDPRLQHPRTQTLGADVVPEAVAADLRQPLYSTEVNRRVVLAALVHHPDAAFQQRGARLVLAPRALGLGHVEQRLRVVRVRRAEGFGLLLRRARVRVVAPSKVAPREFTSPRLCHAVAASGCDGPKCRSSALAASSYSPLRLVPSLLQAVELREVVTSGGDVGIVLALIPPAPP